MKLLAKIVLIALALVGSINIGVNAQSHFNIPVQVSEIERVQEIGTTTIDPSVLDPMLKPEKVSLTKLPPNFTFDIPRKYEDLRKEKENIDKIMRCMDCIPDKQSGSWICPEPPIQGLQRNSKLSKVRVVCYFDEKKNTYVCHPK